MASLRSLPGGSQKPLFGSYLGSTQARDASTHGPLTLSSVTILSPVSADAYFRTDLGLLVAQPSGMCWNPFLPFIIIPEGYNALVTRCGAEIPDGDGKIVHKPGVQCADPFTTVSHLVTRNHCVWNAPIKGCKTLDNVQITIDISVIFRIVNGEQGNGVRFFVHEVTPGGLEQQLKDSVAQELRALARSMRHTEVYACRTGAPAQVARTVDDDDDDDDDEKGPGMTFKEAEASRARGEDRHAQKGIDVTEAMKIKVNQTLDSCVEIVDISITDVGLPSSIAQQMTARTMVRSKQAYEVMEQKFAMLEIKCENEVEQLKLQNDEKESKQKAVGAKEVQDLKEDLAIKRAKHRRQLAEFNEHTTSECHKIEADTKEQANSLALEKARVLDTLRLSAQEEAALAEAQAEAEVQRFRAKTEATVAHNRAEAATTVAQAEKNANAALKKKRELDIDEKRLDVYQALASNKQVVVTDATDAESARLLVSDAVLQQHGGQQSSEAALVAKMNVLRVASNALGMRSEWDQSKLDGVRPQTMGR